MTAHPQTLLAHSDSAWLLGLHLTPYQVDSVLFSCLPPHCYWLWIKVLLELDDHKEPNRDSFFEMTKFIQFANRSHSVQVQSVLVNMFANLKKL